MLARFRAPNVARLLLAASLFAAAGLVADSPASALAGSRKTERAAAAARPELLASSAAFFVAKPGYYRPVVTGGRSFPLARSNFFDLLEFPNDWHEPRMRLVNGKWLLVGVHEGIDITAERGTPIVSMTPGIVKNVGWTFYGGERIGVRGSDGLYYFYAHLAAVAPGISPGARVNAGSYLGRVGNTGYGSEPGHRDEFPAHLHFGIQAANNGPWINPYSTLVSLYSATVRAEQRTEALLERLAVSGNRAAWTRAVQGAFMGLSPWLGE